MFAAGAREVWPGIFGVPSALTDPDDARLIDEASLDPRAYSLIASHLFGAARMGREARSSVVGPDFAVHGTTGLYVVDSSVFPTNLGVNPQHTIMALSRFAAQAWLDHARAPGPVRSPGRRRYVDFATNAPR
jgi:choline dehydrogenase-like flavoprotein